MFIKWNLHILYVTVFSFLFFFFSFVFSFLKQCRELSVSMGNAIKYLKLHISQSSPDKPESEVIRFILLIRYTAKKIRRNVFGMTTSCTRFSVIMGNYGVLKYMSVYTVFAYVLNTLNFEIWIFYWFKPFFILG